MASRRQEMREIGTTISPDPASAPVSRERQRQRQKWRRFRGVAARFAPYLRGRIGTMGFALMAALGYAAMRILEPWPIKLIIDNVFLGHPLPWFASSELVSPDGDSFGLLYVLVAAILVIAFARGFFYYRQRILTAELGIEITADLRLDLYRHLQHLSLAFHARRRTGEALVRLTSDIRMLRQALVTLPLQVIEGILLVVGMAIVMLVMDWRLAILALALVPILAALVRKYRRPMAKAARKQRRREGNLATLASETLGAIRVVQGFRREKDEIKRFGGANRRSRRSEVKLARYEAKLQWSTEVAIAAATAAIVLLASWRVLEASLSPGDLIVFIAYLRNFARPLRRLSGVTKGLARASAAGERVLEILETEPTIKDRPDAVRAPRLQGDIVFDEVSFGYEAGMPVLSGVNLHIKPGEHVAIVGPTGSGKSTLVSLIPRFYDPTEGRICIDGQDVRGYTLSSLREQVSLVFQEPALFATTIAENIAYGRPNATMDEIVEAARRAGIDRVISRLPEGYETVLGERGGTLSGGQRQCVAIARAVIRDAPIVIMDELTTGLDAESAALVLKALDVLMKGRTVVMISHDLHSLRGADRVIDITRDLRGGGMGAKASDSPPAQAGVPAIAAAEA